MPFDIYSTLRKNFLSVSVTSGNGIIRSISYCHSYRGA
jgi:hypothetical protein